jgi:hypothetical protein
VEDIQETGALAGTDHREEEVTILRRVEKDRIKTIAIQK